MEKVCIKFKEHGEHNWVEVLHFLSFRGLESVLIQIREQLSHKDFIELLRSTSTPGEDISIKG